MTDFSYPLEADMTCAEAVERCVWADVDPEQLVYAVIVAALLEALDDE